MEGLDYLLYTLVGFWVVFVFATMYVVTAKLRFWQGDYGPSFYHNLLQLIAKTWRKISDW